MRYCFRILLTLLIMFLVVGSSYAQSVPTGVPIDLDGILNLAKSIGGFLFILGGILAGITIIVSGIAYFTAGSDTARVKMARDILKAGITGSFILFGSGMIVRTIEGFATNPLKFFQ